MTIDVRPVAEEEFDAFVRVDALAFGTGVDTDGLPDVRRFLQLDRTRAAFDGGRLVAASAAVGFELTVPGPATVPAAGITWVGVAPSHRRRGILRLMMTSLLDDAVARGEAVAILTASESLIYGRFGFGVATSKVAFDIDRRHGTLVADEEPGGRLTMLEAGEATKVLPAVHDRARLVQPGDIDRSEAVWARRLRDPESRRGGASPLFHVVHETGGRPDGYATYRVHLAWTDGSPAGRVMVQEVVTLDRGAELALWRFLLGTDLTDVVEAGNRPVDDPLRWMLADPRRLRVRSVRDELWLRLLDVPAALAARRYGVSGRLVLEVVDGFRPHAAGRWVLDGGPDGAGCRPTTEAPELVLDAADLGALYLGGVAAGTLAAAGRVGERRPGSLAVADAMFASRPAPFCRTGF